MYPVLRRLKKRDWVTTYDEPFEGRNRRYYSISDLGYKEMTRIQDEWRDFSRKINDLMLEGDANGK